MSRFKIGDRVRLWKPGHAEHGCSGVVSEVMTIEEYGGWAYRGPHAYRCQDGWLWPDGCSFFRSPLPDAMVVSEDDFFCSETTRR